MAAGAQQRRGGRTQIARLRATRVKVGFGIAAALTFGASMLFARLSYGGHAKQRATPLSPPAQFLGVVRQNQLQSGLLAPPQASPDVATRTS